MPFIRLDDQFYDGPKHAPLSAGAGWLWVLTLAWCNRHLTDGRFPNAIANQLGNIPKRSAAIKELLDGGLWAEDGQHYQIANYLDYQNSREAVEEHRSKVAESRSLAGRAGAAKRWQSDGKRDGKRMAKPIANGSQTDGPYPLPTDVVTSPNNLESVAVHRGGDISTKVLVRMAKAELAVEVQRGQVRSQERWMAAKLDSLRTTHGPRMDALLRLDPTMDERTLHDVLTNPQRRMEWEKARRAGCSTCDGAGAIVNDGVASPCPSCSPERVSA